jgi:hypothetical protein
MDEDDPEKRIAELERQLSDAKPAQPQAPSPPAYPAAASPYQAPAPVPPNFDVHNAFVAAPPFGSPAEQPPWNRPPYPVASYGSPFTQAPGATAARNYVHRMRVTSYLWLLLWLPGIFVLVQGINMGADTQRIDQSGHTAFCGNAFDYAFGNDAFDPFINGGDLRAACNDKLASMQPMVWGLIGVGAALILGSLLVVVIYRINRWRRGWRPWRIFGDIYPGT